MPNERANNSNETLSPRRVKYPKAIRSLPLRPQYAQEIRAHSGVFRVTSSDPQKVAFAKDSSAFYHDRLFFGSKTLRTMREDLPGLNTDGEKLAFIGRAYAAFYSHLRDLGVYHPQSVFSVIKARNGKGVAILGLLPEMLRPLDEWDEPKAVFNRKLEIEKIVRAELHKVIPKAVLPKLPKDWIFSEMNFYHSGDGRVFFTDMHLPGLTRNTHNAIIAWYRSKWAIA
ncbi:MAG: hypothetical protein V1708_04665 [Candidatus Micrarchaeota archaeon]